MLLSEYQRHDLNAIFWAKICGPACSKNAKYAAIMRQKSRNMRRLCSKKLYICDTHASKNSNYAGKSCKYAIKNVNYAVIT